MRTYYCNSPTSDLLSKKLPGLFLLAVLAATATTAQAQVFKCASTDGSVSFSYVPCPPSQGESQYLGEAQRTTSPESSLDVVDRNLRAAEIMREQRDDAGAGTGGTRVTIIKDSSRSPTIGEILRERMERRQSGGGSATEEKTNRRVNTNCHSVGKITNCYGSDGSHSTTTNFGNTSSTTTRRP
ncbi:DUF4124 domain-containing protein [Pseudomonas sp. SA3-5]|uniref:DUF4124 domain-containing protein n=1 Tax=Pseudomonas aestuarii TaxID=3018340 RepID=A0ABT4XAT1_9PSED|nr:DUF4124 domain-containing protein [Pseudomonas aestuarii]MDA7085494.1 DUF4124 domain-containing protein [Pseudomonas aestuarii]